MGKNLYGGINPAAFNYEKIKKELQKKADESGKSVCYCPIMKKEESFHRTPMPALEICPICGRKQRADLRYLTTSKCDFIFVSPSK